MQMPYGLYTIQNFGRKINCSVSILFPSSLTLSYMSIGIPETRNGTMDLRAHRPERQCSSRGLTDYVEIRGGHDLDPMFMSKYNDYCGLFQASTNEDNETTKRPRVDVGCGNTVMRLVSSGTQENKVSFGMTLFFDTQTSPCPRRPREPPRG